MTSKNGIGNKTLFNLNINGVNIRVVIQHNIYTNYNCITTKFDFNKNGGYKNNRNCSMFLGVYIAEQILNKIFKNVEVMPIGNPGYDVICNNGYKIDIKSACLHKDNLWSFDFNKNKIADFFLCIVFNNRTDLNPEHVWLLPANIVNDLTGTSIGKSTLNKWSEYELPLDKIISCCDKMKEIHNIEPVSSNLTPGI